MKPWQTVLLALVLLVCAVIVASSRRYQIQVDGSDVLRIDTLTGKVDYYWEYKGEWFHERITEIAASQDARPTPAAVP